MFSTTEITSHEETSDNVIHQRLLYAYMQASQQISGNVLEVGCGAGRGLEAVLKVCSHYTAIDKNKELIDYHQLQYPSGLFLYKNVPPFEGIESGQFDFVISFQVIEHIKNDKKFVEEIYRVLKPGGTAIITTPNMDLTLTRNPWHIREYKPLQLKTVLSTRFPMVDVYGISGSPKVWEYYSKNKDSVQKITKFDVLNLQHRLPSGLLRVPYELLNRWNRRNLEKGNSKLVNDVSYHDYQLTDDFSKAYDLYAIATK